MTAPSYIEHAALVAADPAEAAAVRRTLGELARYFVASAIALGVDTGLYALGLRLHLGYQFAAVLGFVGGLSVAYLISVRWAFQTRRVGDARLEFVVFAAIGMLGLLMTEALLWFQIDVLHLGTLPAKLVAACGVFLFNFGARKCVLFKARPASRSPAIP